MPFDKEPLQPPTERVKQAYKMLSTVASSLNASTDKLGKSAGELEAALKKLALGVPSWVVFSRNNWDLGHTETGELSYEKHNGKWGLVITSRMRDESQADDLSSETWPFGEAPRHLRVKAVSVIPDLLEKLFENATKMRQEVDSQAEGLDAIAKAVSEAAEEARVSVEPPRQRPTRLLEGLTLADISNSPPGITAANNLFSGLGLSTKTVSELAALLKTDDSGTKRLADTIKTSEHSKKRNTEGGTK